MKKSLIILSVCVLCCSLVFAGCGKESSKQPEAVPETKVTQADIEKNIIGSWIIAERDGKPALTNEKCVVNFVSADKAYISASFASLPDDSMYWGNSREVDVVIDGDKLTLSRFVNEHVTIINEITISEVTDKEQSGSIAVKKVEDGSETLFLEEQMRFVKTDADFSKDVLGTWEGRSTSKDSVYDDGQDHRWTFKDDGSFIYYLKDGDSWKATDDPVSEYFVAGDLLCSRWVNNEGEFREWWDITVEGDTMKWTALREDADGKTFTTSFEMVKVD